MIRPLLKCGRELLPQSGKSPRRELSVQNRHIRDAHEVEDISFKIPGVLKNQTKLVKRV